MSPINRVFLIPLLWSAALAVACSSSSGQKAGDSGGPRGSGSTHDSGSTTEFPLTCTPNLDVSHATSISAPTTQLDLPCWATRDLI